MRGHVNTTGIGLHVSVLTSPAQPKEPTLTAAVWLFLFLLAADLRFSFPLRNAYVVIYRGHVFHLVPTLPTQQNL